MAFWSILETKTKNTVDIIPPWDYTKNQRQFFHLKKPPQQVKTVGVVLFSQTKKQDIIVNQVKILNGTATVCAEEQTL